MLGSSGRGGRTAAFLALLGFVVSFLFIRMSTRMIRAQVSWWPVHLKDVYWTEQGWSSLDAVVLVTAFMALVVLGTKPFGLKGNEAPVIVLLIIVQALLLSVICFLKGRIALGALAVFIPFLGLWGACRLGKPDSPWGRRRYSAAKLNRAHARFPPDSRGRRLRDAFFNAIGGKPSEPVPPQAHS